MQHTSSLRSLAQRTHARWSTLYSSVILSAVASLLTISASTALAQYTYKSVDAPFSSIGYSTLEGLGDGGIMAGTYYDPATVRVKSWTYSPKTKKYAKLVAPKPIEVSDINMWGRTVGTYFNGAAYKGFTMRSGKLHTVQNIPGSEETLDCAINDGHLMACTAAMPQGDLGWRGFLYTAEPQTTFVRWIDVPNAYGTSAYGINMQKDVVGSYLGRDWITRGYGMEGSTGIIHLIDAPCGGHTEVRDVNNARLMAVTCETFPDANDANTITNYAFDGVTWTELWVPNSWETIVTRVNNLGQFAGWYQDVDGTTRGFIATRTGTFAQR